MPESPEADFDQLNPNDVNDDGKYYPVSAGPETLKDYIYIQELMANHVYKLPMHEGSKALAFLN